MIAGDSYLPISDSKIIENTIKKEINQIAGWFQENLLVLNQKKAKQDLFSMEPPTQRLQGAPGVQIIINDTEVSNSKAYEYIGVSVDKSLSFIDQLDKVYHKAVKNLTITNKPNYILKSANFMVIYIIFITIKLSAFSLDFS